MANKRSQKLGYYLLVLNPSNPIENIKSPKKLEAQYIINQSNKLDINDVDIFSLEDKARNHILVSYKSIYINMYSLFIIDLNTGLTIYRHDSFCLWESRIMSFFNTNS